ncbi:tRNA dimethylallyltransferase [compost metagenome]
MANPETSKPPLIVVAGPTASGKSALAMDLAADLDGVILSADSRQVYRGFDIGTAKPTAEELASVPHRLIDVVEPTETYTVAQFRELARAEIAEAHAQGRMPILAGGTGLYIRAVLGGYAIPEVPPDPELRAKLEKLENPHAALAEVDAVSAARLHPNDRVRVIRALEVFHLTGKPISELQTREESPYRVAFLALGWPREALNERINLRTIQMFEAGLSAEVQALAQRYGADLPLLKTLGYAETLRWQLGEMTQEEAIALIQQNTRRYAKRQVTWFRREPDVVWLDPQQYASPRALSDAAREIVDQQLAKTQG